MLYIMCSFTFSSCPPPKKNDLIQHFDFRGHTVCCPHIFNLFCLFTELCVPQCHGTVRTASSRSSMWRTFSLLILLWWKSRISGLTGNMLFYTSQNTIERDFFLGFLCNCLSNCCTAVKIRGFKGFKPMTCCPWYWCNYVYKPPTNNTISCTFWISALYPISAPSPIIQ